MWQFAVISGLPHFYGKISGYVVIYWGKDKGTTQGNLMRKRVQNTGIAIVLLPTSIVTAGYLKELNRSGDSKENKDGISL